MALGVCGTCQRAYIFGGPAEAAPAQRCPHCDTGLRAASLREIHDEPAADFRLSESELSPRPAPALEAPAWRRPFRTRFETRIRPAGA